MDEKQQTKREKRLKKREEQRAATLKAKRAKQMREYGAVAVVLILLVLGGYWMIRSQPEPLPVIETPGTTIENQTGGHIRGNLGHAAYNSNPPTSGPHDATPARCKTYSEKNAPTDEAVVHSLEHGAVWISYKPDAPEDIIEALEGFDSASKVLIAPRADNDSLVAVAAWNKLLKIDEWTDESSAMVNGFIQANRNRGPELIGC